MSDTSREKAILAAQARFKLYEMAREKWPESDGDIAYLSEKLAKTMLESGIYLDINSRLVHFSPEEYDLTPVNTASGSKKPPEKFAVIDMESEEDLVVGTDPGVRGTSSPRLFDSAEEAKRFAMAMEEYQDWHEDCFTEIVFPWNATHISFKKKGGETFSISDADEEAILVAGKERTKALTDLISGIIDIENMGDPEATIHRGMYHDAEEIGHRVENARRLQISRRWDWILEHRGIRDDSGKIKIKKGGKSPSGKHGNHSNPGIVKFASQVDFELASTLIDLLDREVPTIAEVLCRSHVWRTTEEGLQEEKGQARPSLLSQEDIGCRVGDDMGRVASDMIRWQFSIQPIFDPRGSQIGSLELKKITGLVGRGGWGALPAEVSEEALSEMGLLGPMVPIVDPMERSDTVSQVLSSSIDAVIFRWEEARHSKRRGFPEECRGVLEDGLHIVTSHDIMAYAMETGN